MMVLGICRPGGGGGVIGGLRSGLVGLKHQRFRLA
jgi:hypothetical protein